MHRAILLSTAALLALSVAPPAFADDTPETVVVTATRTATPESEIASSMTVVTADDIEAQQDRSMPDALKDVPGLNVVQSGGPGALTSVFMRGTNSNHTKVLIDGIDVSDPSNPTATFDFGQLLTQDIARVEILRGPQSGLYGSDAIGGVINVITKSGSGPATFKASIEGGTYDTFNQSGSVSGSVDGFHYSLNVDHLHTGATPVTPLDLLAPGETRNDDYYDNVTVSTKLGLAVMDNFDLGLVARYTNTTDRFTGDDFSTFPAFPAAQQSQTDTVQYYARATAHLALFDGVLDQTLGFAYSSDHTAAIDPTGFDSPNGGNRVKLDWQGDIRLGEGETLVLGAEHARDAIAMPISAAFTINSGYAELQSSIAGSLFNTASIRYDDHDRFAGKFTYRLAPAYVIHSTGTKLKASIGSGFKAPTLSQLFQSFPPFFFANPNLKPETSLGWDAGVEQSLLDDALRGGVTYFHNDIRNLITGDVTGTTSANIGRARTSGVESFVAYRPIPSLMLRADYTYVEAIDAATHLELLRRPKNKASFDVRWQAMDRLSLDATLLTVGPWVDGNRDFSIPRLKAPGYTTLNLSASYALTERYALFGRVDNLFDEDYQNPVGFLAPGRGFFAGLKARI